MDVMGGGDVPTRLSKIHDELAEFCQGNGIPLHLTGLTRTLVNFSKDSDYPCGYLSWKPFFVECNYIELFQDISKHAMDTQPRMWFKGADTTAVVKFVEQKYSDLHAPMWDDFCCSVHDGAESVNKFLSLLYHSGLWLRPTVARNLIRYGMDFQTHYLECSQFAFNMKKTRFKLPPKFHALTHIVHDLLMQVGEVGEENLKRDAPCILSPLSWCCQQDEDFVGRVAALSRTGVLRTAHERTMMLYLMNLSNHWWTKRCWWVMHIT